MKKNKESMQITIDFSQIQNMEDFYTELSKQIELPQHFGRNLDALNDVITSGENMPLTLDFENLNIDKYEEFMDLIDVLDEISEELDGFEFNCFFAE